MQAIREVMTEVTGLSPFQRKMMEMLKTGDSVKEKKAVRVARKRTGSHKRAQLVRDKIAAIIQAQDAAKRAAKKWDVPSVHRPGGLWLVRAGQISTTMLASTEQLRFLSC